MIRFLGVRRFMFSICTTTAVYRIQPLFAFGFYFGCNFFHHRLRRRGRCRLRLLLVFLPVIPAEPSAGGKQGDEGDNQQELGKGFFIRFGFGVEKVEFIDTVKGEADIFGFVASASAFDDVE